MLVDHLPLLLPGMFTLVAGFFEFLGYVSVAEGFVYISGYVTGLVYTRIRREKGDGCVRQKAFFRAFCIYACYVAAVILLLLGVRCGGRTDIISWAWATLANESLSTASVKVFGLLYQPAFLEILPMYSLFLLFAPLIIKLLDQGRHILVAILSVLIWATDQCGARHKILDVLFGGADVHFGFFSSFAWQILYVGGLICGHRSCTTKAPWLPKGWQLPLLAYIAAVIFFALHREILDIRLSQRWIDRSSLGPLRLLNFACLAFLAAIFRKQIEQVIAWKGLTFLSRHSLQVFAFHLIPVYVASLFIVGRTVMSWQEQLLFIGFCILGLYQIAWTSHFIKDGLFKRTQIVAIPRTSGE
jgi:hypothetical protein